MKKIALITGITGQDGSYLAELLLEKGYDVHGIIRRSSSLNTGRIDHIFNDIKLYYGDMTDGASLSSIMHKVGPHEIYHLAAQSHVQVSFELPEYTALADGVGTLKLLEAMRNCEYTRESRFYNACTSEMFGSAPAPQNENTPFMPCSPYGTAKLYSYWITRNYRESYNMHVSNGILFNHESPRRGETFVTRKIVKAAVRCKLGKQTSIKLGNLGTKRDWGHAKDYVRAMWMMLQQEIPDDYVIATGISHSITDLLDYTFEKLDLDWGHYIAYDNKYYRPNEVYHLEGDASKAKRVLGWEPEYTFEQMIDEMIEEEMKYELSTNN